MYVIIKSPKSSFLPNSAEGIQKEGKKGREERQAKSINNNWTALLLSVTDTVQCIYVYALKIMCKHTHICLYIYMFLYMLMHNFNFFLCIWYDFKHRVWHEIINELPPWIQNIRQMTAFSLRSARGPLSLVSKRSLLCHEGEHCLLSLWLLIRWACSSLLKIRFWCS